MKQTMKCFTAVARKGRAQARGMAGIAGLLRATAKGLASTHPDQLKSF